MDDGDTVTRYQVPTQSAAPRRGKFGVLDECEGKGANVATGNGDGCSGENNNDISEMVQLMRGLMGRLDRLEEPQTKIQGQISEGAQVNKIVDDAQMSPGEDLNLFASGLGRGPRMHIDALSGMPSPAKSKL